MRKVLVTGGAGFIGSHLCDALVARGDQVTVLDNLTSGKSENLAGCADRLRAIEGDIRDLPRLGSEIGPVDLIVHLAALISGHDSLYQPDEYFDVNVSGMLRLIEFAVEKRVPRIVFASSSTVYGAAEDERLGEESQPKPLTVYALTKLAGEHLLALYGRIHGFSHVSLRLFNVYGPRQAVDHPYANVICKFSHAAAAGGAVRRYGDGEQTRDFIFVDDVVQAFLSVAEGSAGTIYNVGTGTASSINSILGQLAEISRNPIEVEQHPDWPNDVRRVCADTSRLEREFGLSSRTSVRDGLIETVRSFSGPAA